MMKKTVEYELLPTEGECFFIGMNSFSGYRDMFGIKESELDGYFILKGGPGTGKSTVMKKMAENAEASGAAVTKYFCSSDPFSFDGTVIDNGGKRIAVCDGTSPHVRECAVPGAISEIVDLIEFMDKRKLKGKSERIIELSAKKADRFKAAYGLFDAAQKVRHELNGILTSACDTEKIATAAERIVGRAKKVTGERSLAVTEAFSMKGCFALATFLKKAEKTDFLTDRYGIGNIFLNLLDNGLTARGIRHTVTVHPIDPSVITAVYLPGQRTLYSSVRYGNAVPGRKMNSERWAAESIRENKDRLGLLLDMEKSLIRAGLSELSEAEKCHEALESVYSASMNFGKLEKSLSRRLPYCE